MQIINLLFQSGNYFVIISLEPKVKYICSEFQLIQRILSGTCMGLYRRHPQKVSLLNFRLFFVRSFVHLSTRLWFYHFNRRTQFYETSHHSHSITPGCAPSIHLYNLFSSLDLSLRESSCPLTHSNVTQGRFLLCHWFSSTFEVIQALSNGIIFHLISSSASEVAEQISRLITTCMTM